MFNLLKYLVLKNLPQVIEEKFPEPVSYKTHQYLNHLADKLTDPEKRLDYVEEHGKEKNLVDQLIESVNKYDEEVKRFSKIEREYISLTLIDLLKNLVIGLIFSSKGRLSLHKKIMTRLEWNNWLWTFRCYL